MVAWWLSHLYSATWLYFRLSSPLFTFMAQVFLRIIQVTGPTTLACKRVKARQKRGLWKLCLKWDAHTFHFSIPRCLVPGCFTCTDTHLSNPNEWSCEKMDKFLTCAILVTFERVTRELLCAVAAQVHVALEQGVGPVWSGCWYPDGLLGDAWSPSVALEPLHVCYLCKRQQGEEAYCCHAVGKAVKPQSSWSIWCLRSDSGMLCW